VFLPTILSSAIIFPKTGNFKLYSRRSIANFNLSFSFQIQIPILIYYSSTKYLIQILANPHLFIHSFLFSIYFDHPFHFAPPLVLLLVDPISPPFYVEFVWITKASRPHSQFLANHENGEGNDAADRSFLSPFGFFPIIFHESISLSETKEKVAEFASGKLSQLF